MSTLSSALVAWALLVTGVARGDVRPEQIGSGQVAAETADQAGLISAVNGINVDCRRPYFIVDGDALAVELKDLHGKERVNITLRGLDGTRQTVEQEIVNPGVGVVTVRLPGPGIYKLTAARNGSAETLSPWVYYRLCDMPPVVIEAVNTEETAPEWQTASREFLVRNHCFYITVRHAGVQPKVSGTQQFSIAAQMGGRTLPILGRWCPASDLTVLLVSSHKPPEHYPLVVSIAPAELPYPVTFTGRCGVHFQPLDQRQEIVGPCLDECEDELASEVLEHEATNMPALSHHELDLAFPKLPR